MHCLSNSDRSRNLVVAVVVVVVVVWQKQQTYVTNYKCIKQQKMINPVFDQQTDTPRLMHLLHSGDSVQVQFCTSQNWVCTWSTNYTYMYIQGSSLESQTPIHWNMSATAWLPCCLCYCPAVFFHHLHLIVLSLKQGKIQRAFWKHCFFFFSVFKNCTKSEIAKVLKCLYGYG